MKGYKFLPLIFWVVVFSGCATADPLVEPEKISLWEEPKEIEIPWWNEGVFYEIYVRSFKDSDGDRFGDFQGLIEKLDYLNDGDPQTTDDLGIRAIWLMPIQENQANNPHGYHTEDYYSVEEDYGTLEDLKLLIQEANKRGIRVITDLVINHVSNTHPWFQSALQGPSSPYYNWFVWSDTMINEEGPWGQSVWHTPDGGKTYYFGIFNFLIPDLNYRNPEVTAEIQKITKYWLEEVGLDGFRIDASRHLIEEGDILEDHPETFQWFRDHYYPFYKAIGKDKYVIGEQFAHPDRPEYQVAGEALDMSFDHFVRISMQQTLARGTAAAMEKEWTRILEQYPNSQFGTFISNHDQDRFMSFLEELFPQEETAILAMKASAALFLTLPGVPYLYYGEELGQLGKGRDDNKRRAMQWDNTPGSHGFTSAPRPYGQGFNQGALDRTVENQTDEPESLLSHYRNLISLRNSRESLQMGETLILPASHPSIFAYFRYVRGERTLVIQNVSDQNLSSPAVALWSGPFQGEVQARNLLGERILLPAMANEYGGLGKYSPVEEMGPFETLVIALE